MKTFAIAAFAGALMMAGAAIAQPAVASNSITISGQGTVAAAPDVANLSLGVVARADTAQEALAAMSQSMAQVLSALQDQGVEGHNIQTQSLGLSPLRADLRTNPKADPLQVVAFEARSQVSAQITDIQNLGATIDALVDAGANDISRLSFGLQNVDEKRNEARKKAVEDAFATARLYAEAAGVSLGDVLSISETGGSPRPEMKAAMMMADSGVPIAEGEVSVTARVTLVIALEP